MNSVMFTILGFAFSAWGGPWRDPCRTTYVLFSEVSPMSTRVTLDRPTLIVVHGSNRADPTGVAREATDTLMQQFSAAGNPTIALTFDRGHSWYTAERDFQHVIGSPDGRHHVVAGTSEVTFAGAQYPLRRNTALGDLLSQASPGPSLTVNMPLHALFELQQNGAGEFLGSRLSDRIPPERRNDVGYVEQQIMELSAPVFDSARANPTVRYQINFDGSPIFELGPRATPRPARVVRVNFFSGANAYNNHLNRAP